LGDAGEPRSGVEEVVVSILARLLDRPGAAGPEVEVMRHRHIGQILAIEQAAYPKPWTAKVFHDELDQQRERQRRYLVARHGRSVVGYGGLMFVGDEAHVTNVAVHPDHRRQGIATLLLGHLALVAIGRGCTAWTLEVRTSSVGAQALYRAFGFVPAGVRARYYEGTEDAIVMWCHDIQSEEYARRLEGLKRD
jgi:[ribosomal protein S18]-alanine N-acetyltransferase